MKRREVLQKLAYTVPVGITMPTLLSSCQDHKVTPTPVYDGTVVIIGAGAAGMYAAQLLMDRKIDVTVLEATSLYGGRLRVQKEFFDFPLEMGADNVIGNDNIWYSTIEKSGFTLDEIPAKPLFSVDNKAQTADELSDDPDFIAAMEFINNIPDYNGPDLTVENAAASANISPRVRPIVNGVVANSRGTSYNKISIRGISEGQNIWSGGDGVFRVRNQSLVNILFNAFSDVVPKIKIDTQVKVIDYTGINLVRLTDQHGNVTECNRVIITCPLNVLKSGDISFSPNLPSTTTNAMDLIGMSKGIKLALHFYVNFWGQQFSSIYSEGVAPEYYAAGITRDDGNQVLMATINGENAAALEGKTDQEITQFLLDDLDSLFNGEASQQFNESFVTNWGAEPFFQGVSSFPLVSGSGAPEQFALPVNDRLFFAGEATATNGNYGTVQGALESSERVVEEVLSSIL